MSVREVHIPLRHKMGAAWGCANAALFLNSDRTNFITGIALVADGGRLVSKEIVAMGGSVKEWDYCREE